MNEIPKNLIRFVVLVLIQVMILNNIQVSGFINPYMYVLFILLLPFETPNWLLLLLSFFLGLSVDVAAITKGKGWQGVITRYGAKRKQHKSRKTVRELGSLGPISPQYVMYIMNKIL